MAASIEKADAATFFDALTSVEAGKQNADDDDCLRNSFSEVEQPSGRSNDIRRVSQYRQHRISKRESDSARGSRLLPPSPKKRPTEDDLMKRWSAGDPEKATRSVWKDVPAKRASAGTPQQEQAYTEARSGLRLSAPPAQTPPLFRNSELPPYPPTSSGSWPRSALPDGQPGNRTSHAAPDKQNDLLYYRKRFHVGKRTLFYTVSHRYDRGRPKKTVLDLAAVQRMGLHDLRRNIARKVGKMYRDGGVSYSRANEMLGDMHRYCKHIIIRLDRLMCIALAASSALLAPASSHAQLLRFQADQPQAKLCRTCSS